LDIFWSPSCLVICPSAENHAQEAVSINLKPRELQNRFTHLFVFGVGNEFKGKRETAISATAYISGPYK
jgi:hypothetical protein